MRKEKRSIASWQLVGVHCFAAFWQILVFFTLFSLPVLAQDKPEKCNEALSVPPYASKGIFDHSKEREEMVRLELIKRLQSAEDKARGLLTEARRVEASDLSMNFNEQRADTLQALRIVGLANIDKLVVITSGAGLWSRGGGQVKAEVPYNQQEILSEASIKRLTLLGEIVKASTVEKVLELSGQSPKEGETNEQAVARIRKETALEIDSIIKEAKVSPLSLNALDMKFVMAAVTSETSGSYLVLDIWTSQQTHGQISSYIRWLERNFELKSFHPDVRVDHRIKNALKHYFRRSHELGETHLFGYQVGIRAFSSGINGRALGDPIENSEPIGEGAGMLKTYLDESGRTERFARMGKTHFIFENIEVQNDYALIFGAHLNTQKPTSIVLVPQQKGYSGGNGFVVKKPDGSENIELHETAVMSKELREGHSFFNSNTIVQSLDSQPPIARDFEPKDNGLIYRAKVNAGDITKVTPTAAIGGRIGVEYENFKSFEDYAKNGTAFVRNFQHIWKLYFFPSHIWH